jgi:hypothetical protein
VLFKFENATIVKANAFENTVPIEKPVIEYRNPGFGGID